MYSKKCRLILTPLKKANKNQKLGSEKSQQNAKKNKISNVI
jgi:hypothetical protein